MVEGPERSRHVIRRVVGRRVRAPQADPRRHPGQDAEDRAKVQLDGPGAVPDRLGDRVAVDAGHGEPIIEEHQIEATRFEQPSQVRVVVGLEEPQVSGGMPP
jgi:hypothetical protein